MRGSKVRLNIFHGFRRIFQYWYLGLHVCGEPARLVVQTQLFARTIPTDDVCTTHRSVELLNRSTTVKGRQPELGFHASGETCVQEGQQDSAKPIQLIFGEYVSHSLQCSAPLDSLLKNLVLL